MKIDVELTDEERDALLWLLGAGMAGAIRFKMWNNAKLGIHLLNLFFADSPDYTPYDETSFNPENLFPFERVKPQ